MKPNKTESRPAMRTKVLLLSGATMIALAAGTAFWLFPAFDAGQRRIGQNDTLIENETMTAASANAARQRPQFEWVKGAHAVYQYRLEATTSIEAIESSPGRKPTAAYAAAARMHLRVVDTAAKGPLVAFQLEDAQIIQAGVRMKNLENLACTVPCLVQMDRNGRILAMHFPAQLVEGDRSSLAALYATQIILPDSTGSSKWQTVEDDLYGNWTCDYALASGEPVTIRKGRRPVSAAGGAIQMESQSSDTHCTLGPIWLQELKSEERLAIMHDKQLLSLVSVKISLQQTDTTSQMPAPLAALAPGDCTAGIKLAELRGKSMRGLADSSASRDEQSLLRQKFENISCTDCVRNLEQVLATARSHSDTVQAIHDLSDMVRAFPERAAELAAMVPGAAANTEMTARMIHALELAGKQPEAQAALASLLKDGAAPKSVLEQAAVAAGGVGEIKSRALLENLCQLTAHEDVELSDAASFAVGALAATNAPLQKMILDTYPPALDAGNQDTDDMRVALRVLHNSGVSNPQIIADSAGIAQRNAVPSVRAAALDYLGRVSPDHPELMIPSLQDADESVRIAAVNALTSTSKTTAQAVKAVAQVLEIPDISPDLQSAAISALGSHSQTFQEARQALLKVQSNPNLPADQRARVVATLADPTVTVFPDQLTMAP